MTESHRPRTASELWGVARDSFLKGGDVNPHHLRNMEAMDASMGQERDVEPDEEEEEDAASESSSGSSSEAVQPIKGRASRLGRGVVRMRWSLHPFKHDKSQKPSLGSRFWNKMHLWKSEGQAAADKLARSFTADRSFGSRGSGAVDSIPPLCIVMLVAGTRGDVQPFIALGQGLQQHGHRVRLATHAVYRSFVEDYGLEFYPLGGNPQVLSEYMVRNRGILPGGYNDIVKQRKELRDIVFSVWPACTEPDPEKPDRSFRAEAVIANPVCYGHEHCAEALRVPLHMVFTMPWSPTGEFAHPMARIMYTMRIANSVVKRSNRVQYYRDAKSHYKDLMEDSSTRRGSWNKWAHMKGVQLRRLQQRAILRQMEAANRLSYAVIDDMLFQGVSDLLDRLRTEQLGLQSMGHVLRVGQGYAHYYTVHKTPFTYTWSTAVAPRPRDWGPHIDIAGYLTLDSSKADSYQPPKELAAFLEKCTPIYIGFGSLVVDDPEKLTRKIYRALEETGESALIGKGWGNLGKIEGEEVPDNVLLIDAVPHDWLFKRCKAVIHHGGAGTTAAGLIAACPTTVVPFFGDQSFWGEAVLRAGAGPQPIPVDKLRTRRLVEAIRAMNKPEVKAKAEAIASQLNKEDGVAKGVAAFHRHLPRRFLQEKQAALTGEPPPLTPRRALRRRLSSGEYRLDHHRHHHSHVLAWLSVKAWWHWLKGTHPAPLPGSRPTQEPSRTPSDLTVGPDQHRKRRAEGLRHPRGDAGPAASAPAEMQDASQPRGHASSSKGPRDHANSSNGPEEGSEHAYALQAEDEYGASAAAAMQGRKGAALHGAPERGGGEAGQELEEGRQRQQPAEQSNEVSQPQGHGSKGQAAGDRMADAVLGVVRMQHAGRGPD